MMPIAEMWWLLQDFILFNVDMFMLHMLCVYILFP